MLSELVSHQVRIQKGHASCVGDAGGHEQQLPHDCDSTQCEARWSRIMLEPIKWAEARTAREQIEREVGVAAQTPGTCFPAVLREPLISLWLVTRQPPCLTS